MKNIFKKIIVGIIAVLTVGVVIAPEAPAQAQFAYCGSCCDVNPYTGTARVRCTLVSPWPCGGTCVCLGVVGAGFACY